MSLVGIQPNSIRLKASSEASHREARPGEPIAVARIEGGLFDRRVADARHQLLISGQALYNPSGGIDHRGKTVVGRAYQEAAIFDRAHASDQQVLRTRFAAPEIGVVRKIHQNVRALFRELADQVRKGGFVADEHAEPLARGRQHLDLRAGHKIAGFLGHAIHEPKRARHEFAERHEVDLVVTARLRGPQARAGRRNSAAVLAPVNATVPNRK